MSVGQGGAPTPQRAATSAGANEDRVTGPVKLVVWDLDETLWAGTLSEGEVVLDPSRAELVRALNRRGIVNAICSNNDAEAARAMLDDSGLLDQFVFARIDWTPKGPRVAQIIEDAQLRAENVLFIDDLPLNRREVRHFSPGIQTAAPEISDDLLSLPELTGKDDRALTRLEQYRVLERKLADRALSDGRNESFLWSCDIRIGIFRDGADEAERLYELATRAHQLNFTKRRPTRDDFVAMLANPRFDTGYVRVRDRYGDYGICGFFSVDRDQTTVVDLLFSCRVLHMGVEQWVYDHLGRPPLTVLGEVASSLEGSAEWIELDPASFEIDPEEAHLSGRGSEDGLSSERVLIVGGCDLTTTAQYLGGDISTHFAHNGPSGAFIHVGHTELLRQSASGITESARAIVDRIPFIDLDAYSSPAVVDPDYDVLVLSVLTDYTQGLYRHRRLGLVVPWYQCHVDVTNEFFWPWIVKRYAREGVDRDFLIWFAAEFESLGGITPQRFAANIRWLSGAVPQEARMIFLNGAEIALHDPREPDRHLRHKAMNDVLDSTVAELGNASVYDVRTLVTDADDLAGNLRHYRRHVYLRMAEEIRASASPGLRVVRERFSSRAARGLYQYAGRRKIQIRRLRKRLRRTFEMSPKGGPR
jgi:FkbH-like protein